MDILVLFLLNTVVFTLAFIILSRRFHRMYSSQRFLDTVESEAQRIMAALNQNAEENIRILEDRIETLERLNARSEVLLRRLEGLVPGGGPAERQPAAPPPAAPVQNQAAELPVEIPVSTPAPVHTPPPTPRELVLSLARQGLSSAMIAQRCGIPLGEVELIISFHGRL